MLNAGKLAACAVLLTLAALLAYSCGGDATINVNGDTPAAAGPCDLVTPQEAQDILGEPVKPAEQGSTTPYETCTYNVQSTAVKFVLVQQRSGVKKDQFTREIQDAADLLGEEAVGVDGVGDAAFRFSGLLYSHDGDTEVVMTVVLGAGTGNDDEVLTAEKALAIKALDRLN